MSGGIAPPEPLHEAESMPVQLTRMEGNLKLILFQVTDNSRRTSKLETDVSNLKSLTQSLREGAVASTEKAEALALALKEAKEAVEATALSESNKAQAVAREEATKAALGWSPITRVFAIAAGALAVFNLYQATVGG